MQQTTEHTANCEWTKLDGAIDGTIVGFVVGARVGGAAIHQKHQTQSKQNLTNKKSEQTTEKL